MSLQQMFSTGAFGGFLLLGSLHSVFGLLQDHVHGIHPLLFSQGMTDILNNKCGKLLSPVNTDNVTFNLYTKHNRDNPYSLVTGNIQNCKNSPRNPLWKTIVIVHGWMESPSSPWIVPLHRAYLDAGNYNVIVVNWYPLSTNAYTAAVGTARVVAKLLGEFLEFMSATLHISLHDFHIIGHRLGAQIAGLSTQHISKRVGRITGLDPPAPCFDYPVLVDNAHGLDSSDAEFVDIVHTSGELFGIQRSIGHTDFFPNGGVAPQPGCNLFKTMCSHARALDFWIDSVIYPNQFVGVKCDSWDKYKIGKCVGNPTAIMGEQTSYLSRGDYYLVTVSESPYGTV